MSIWAIVPMKSLQFGKSRLSDGLSREKRSTLSLYMFFNVLNAVIPVLGARHVVVVSKDAKILSVARNLRLHVLRDSRAGDLNAALRQGTAYAMSRGAKGTLVVFGDLPFVRAGEIVQMIKTARNRRCVIVSPDRAGTGTNALFVSPPDTITFRFGPNSFRKHKSEALSLRRQWSVFRSVGLADDVDHLEDVKALVATVPVLENLINSKAVPRRPRRD